MEPTAMDKEAREEGKEGMEDFDPMEIVTSIFGVPEGGMPAADDKEVR
jgi:hypothetical protein